MYERKINVIHIQGMLTELCRAIESMNFHDAPQRRQNGKTEQKRLRIQVSATISRSRCHGGIGSDRIHWATGHGPLATCHGLLATCHGPLRGRCHVASGLCNALRGKRKWPEATKCQEKISQNQISILFFEFPLVFEEFSTIFAAAFRGISGQNRLRSWHRNSSQNSLYFFCPF